VLWYNDTVHRPLLLSVLCALTCLVPVAMADPPEEGGEPPVRDLPELVEAARATYPSLRAADHRLEAARARLSEAWISPFSQFRVTAGLTFAPEARGTNVFSPDPQLPLDNPWRPVARVGVEGVVPLYTFGKLGAARDAARAGIRAAEHDRERNLASVLYDVRRAYYGLQLSLDVQQMISEGQGRIQSAYDRLEERLEAGDEEANEHDRYRLASTLAEVEARRSEAVRLEQSARAALSTLTGVERFRVPECPLEPLEVELRPMAAYVAAGGGERPELGMLDAGLDARRAELDATRARYFPDLALVLGASYSYGPGVTDQTNPFVPDQANLASLGGGLVARWSLDLVGNAQRVRRVESLLAETEALAAEARNGIALEVRTTYLEMEDAHRRQEAWSRGHRESRAWFVASASAYQVGALEPRDLVDSVKAYFTARFSHLSAIRDYNTAVAKLERVTGAPVMPAAGWRTRCEE